MSCCDVTLKYNKQITKKLLNVKSGDFICKDNTIWIKQGKISMSEIIDYATRKFIIKFTTSETDPLIVQHQNYW